MKSILIYEEETYAIRGAIFEVYKEMKNGYREEVYQQCLELELSARGIPFQSKPELHVIYKGTPIEKTYIPDLVCYGKIDNSRAEDRDHSRRRASSATSKLSTAYEDASRPVGELCVISQGGNRTLGSRHE